MPTTTHFGCRKCTNIHFSTLDLALQHLRRSPVHHADTLELIEKFDSGYRVVAARTLLFSFSINSESEHDAAIEEAELQATAAKAGVDAALRAKRAASLRDQRMGEGDDMGVAKRTCRGGPAAGSCVDVRSFLRGVWLLLSVSVSLFLAASVSLSLSLSPPPPYSPPFSLFLFLFPFPFLFHFFFFFSFAFAFAFALSSLSLFFPPDSLTPPRTPLARSPPQTAPT